MLATSNIERSLYYYFFIPILSYLHLEYHLTLSHFSIGAPFTEIMFNFTHAQALEWNSYDQTIVGALTIAVFLLYAFTNYTKW